MTSFIALYRGDWIGRPQIIAVSTNKQLVATVAEVMLIEENERQSTSDPVLAALREGRRDAIAAVASQSVMGGSDYAE